MCWYCCWGWSQAVQDIYDRFLLEAGEPAMHYGPAHIVWDDENFEREHVQWCLDHADDHRHPDATDAQHEAVKQSLRALLALPDDVLAPAPAAYYESDEPAQNFPPPAHVPMARS